MFFIEFIKWKPNGFYILNKNKKNEILYHNNNISSDLPSLTGWEYTNKTNNVINKYNKVEGYIDKYSYSHNESINLRLNLPKKKQL